MLPQGWEVLKQALCQKNDFLAVKETIQLHPMPCPDPSKHRVRPWEIDNKGRDRRCRVKRNSFAGERMPRPFQRVLQLVSRIIPPITAKLRKNVAHHAHV